MIDILKSPKHEEKIDNKLSTLRKLIVFIISNDCNLFFKLLSYFVDQFTLNNEQPIN